MDREPILPMDQRRQWLDDLIPLTNPILEEIGRTAARVAAPSGQPNRTGIFVAVRQWFGLGAGETNRLSARELAYLSNQADGAMARWRVGQTRATPSPTVQDQFREARQGRFLTDYEALPSEIRHVVLGIARDLQGLGGSETFRDDVRAALCDWFCFTRPPAGERLLAYLERETDNILAMHASERQQIAQTRTSSQIIQESVLGSRPVTQEELEGFLSGTAWPGETTMDREVSQAEVDIAGMESMVGTVVHEFRRRIETHIQSIGVQELLGIANLAMNLRREFQAQAQAEVRAARPATSPVSRGDIPTERSYDWGTAASLGNAPAATRHGVSDVPFYRATPSESRAAAQAEARRIISGTSASRVIPDGLSTTLPGFADLADLFSRTGMLSRHGSIAQNPHSGRVVADEAASMEPQAAPGAATIPE